MDANDDLGFLTPKGTEEMLGTFQDGDLARLLLSTFVSMRVRANFLVSLANSRTHWTFNVTMYFRLGKL